MIAKKNDILPINGPVAPENYMTATFLSQGRIIKGDFTISGGISATDL